MFIIVVWQIFYSLNIKFWLKKLNTKHTNILHKTQNFVYIYIYKMFYKYNILTTFKVVILILLFLGCVFL